MKKKNSKAKHSIRKRISFILITGWLLPVTIMYVFMTVIYQNAIIKRTEDITKENIEYISNSFSTRLNAAIDTAKHFSYEKNIEESLNNYKNNEITYSKLSSNIKERLNINFNNNNIFNISCLFLTDSPDRLHFTYKDYSDYDFFAASVLSEALRISELNSSDIHIFLIDSRIYLIRNMYTLTNYQKFGTLTLELDRDILFDNINLEYLANTAVFINSPDTSAYSSEYSIPENAENIFNTVKNHYTGIQNDIMTKINTKEYQGFLYERKYRDYHLGVHSIIEQGDIYKVLSDLNLIIMLIWIIVIPIVLYLSRYIYIQINKPLTKIISAADRLEKGEVGVQIDNHNVPNLEFETLITAFNKASYEIKTLIDRTYKEELAKKDAKIMALQSQINPHFLNNTLEMMNWQARMSGDIIVSKMIEALSIFLEQGMDRKNKRLIPLSEVIRCADAYFYITSMRYGKRLITEKEVDESLLTSLVPPLILQPILENAVVHGIEKKKQGRIWLRIFRQEDNIVMQVINTGKTLTKEDTEHVNNLLSKTHEINRDEANGYQSLGIRNVNERINLIYGEEYGLTIRPYEEGKTIAEIIIPIRMP